MSAPYQGKRKPPPVAPPNTPPWELVFDCDWGHCARESRWWRWSPVYRNWIPVCDRHSLAAERRMQRNWMEEL